MLQKDPAVLFDRILFYGMAWEIYGERDALFMEIVWRKLEHKDRAGFFRLIFQPEVARYMRFDVPKGEEEAERILERYLAEPECFALLDGKTLAGVLAFGGGENGCYDLSLFWDSAYWNRGLSTEVMKKVMVYAGEKLKVKALRAHIVSENRASCRLAEKQGFTVTQRLRFPELAGELLVYQYDY